MRTTLKRGVGRGAGANGNGRAVFPPGRDQRRHPLPAAAAARRSPGSASLGRILLGHASWRSPRSALAVAGGAYLYFHQSVAAVRAHTPDVIKAPEGARHPEANEPAIALVIGYDHRAGVEANRPSLSDTLMLIRADPRTKSISLLSFPRDLDVPIYCGAGDGEP